MQSSASCICMQSRYCISVVISSTKNLFSLKTPLSTDALLDHVRGVPKHLLRIGSSVTRVAEIGAFITPILFRRVHLHATYVSQSSFWQKYNMLLSTLLSLLLPKMSGFRDYRTAAVHRRQISSHALERNQ